MGAVEEGCHWVWLGGGGEWKGRGGGSNGKWLDVFNWSFLMSAEETLKSWGDGRSIWGGIYTRINVCLRKRKTFSDRSRFYR